MNNCKYCGATGNLLRCGGCKKVWYCSREHQKEDWKSHKNVCATTKSETNELKNYSKIQPTSSDIPFKHKYLKSGDSIEQNLLLLVHGLGDTEEPFFKLAQNMKLPQTSCISLRGPLEVPLIENSYCWIPSIDENDFSFIKNSPKRLFGLKQVRKQFHNLFSVLEQKYNWNPSNIFLLGFSQGAEVILDAAITYPKRIGGVIGINISSLTTKAISGTVLDEFLADPDNISIEAKEIPMLFTHGNKDEQVDISFAKQKYEKLKKVIGNSTRMEFKEYLKGHQMINSKEEMKEIMEFFGKNISLRNIALETRSDIVEVKSLSKT